MPYRTTLYPVMSEQKQTVHVVDDDDRMRPVIGEIVESIGVSCRTYASAMEFLAVFDPHQPGCLILDVFMPGLGGLALQEELATRGAIAPIIFITGSVEVPIAVKAMRRGAFDYLQKPFRKVELVETVRNALSHDRRNRAVLDERQIIRDRIISLTAKERDVLNLLVRGLPNKVVAQKMGLSQRTVELHRSRVMEKMDASSAAHLVRMVMEIEDPGKPAKGSGRTGWPSDR